MEDYMFHIDLSHEESLALVSEGDFDPSAVELFALDAHILMTETAWEESFTDRGYANLEASLEKDAWPCENTPSEVSLINDWVEKTFEFNLSTMHNNDTLDTWKDVSTAQEVIA
jgi:hypothetical protein